MFEYTIKILETARPSSNSSVGPGLRERPNKYRPAVHLAMDELERVSLKLKECGDLPWTAQELLEHALDKAFPDARNQQVVEHGGKRYERRWVPVERNAGVVSRWRVPGGASSGL